MAQAATMTGLRNMPGRAIVYMVSAAFLIIILDTTVKWLVKGGYSPFQIGFLRYLVGLGVSAGIATKAGGIGTLRTRRPGGHLLRSVLNLTTMLTFYYALKRLPLADAIAIGFATPLFTTALSVPMLGEKVGPRRWVAVAFGFVGVLLVVQPTATGIGLGAALALLSALCWALTQVTSRQISGTEPSHTILFYYSLSVVVALGVTMPRLWIEPHGLDWLWFMVCGVAGSFGQFCYNQAFRYGEASMVSPFDYTGLIWAIFLGFVVFGELPSWLVIAGATLIIGSSVYIARRETRLARLARTPAAGNP